MNLGAGNRFGQSAVVNGPLGRQTSDRIVNRARFVPASSQPLADLRLGQLSPGQHLERLDIGAARASRARSGGRGSVSS